MDDDSYETLVIIIVAVTLQAIARYKLDLLNLEQQEHQRRQVVPRKKRRRYGVHPMWRNRSSEGEFVLITRMLTDTEDKFYDYFRLSRNCFETLLEKIQHQLVRKDTRMKKPISPRERLAVCLRFLTTGDTYKTISSSFRMGHSTVHAIVTETCRVIATTLLPETIFTPSMERWEAIRQQFWEQCKFPNCLGAIDGKRVDIKAQANSGSLYLNYKKPFSIVLMAVADANSNFIAIEVGGFGHNSNGEIFAESKLGQGMSNGTYPMLTDSNLPGTLISAPCVIVGDETFPLKRNLLTPYPSSQAKGNPEMTHFNTRLSIARRVVQNAFGMLTQKFGIYNRRIHTTPENLNYIITATCTLHNYIRGYEASNEASGRTRQGEDFNMEHDGNWHSLSHHGSNSTSGAFGVRKTFKDFLFTSRNAD